MLSKCQYAGSIICFIIFITSCLHFYLFTKNNDDYLNISASASMNGSENICQIKEWNAASTSKLPHPFSLWLWKKLNLSKENTQNNSTNTIISAYLYQDYIAVTMTAQHMLKKPIYCRYFDCNKNEIPNSFFQTEVFPESTVHCLKRRGAEFISLSEHQTDITMDVFPMIYRAHKEPVHQFSVCLSPIYGQEPKWLLFAEFIEDYKLQGATHFYVYVGEISSYDQRIVDYYASTGEVEIVRLHDNDQRPFYSWQIIAINDCLHRSKYHSKWAAFVDLDERMQTFGSNNVVNILRSVNDDSIAGITPMMQRVARTEDYSLQYENEERLESDLIFRKFKTSIVPTWNGTKMIIRPEKVGIMHVHYAVALYPGSKVAKITSDKIVTRHYRSLKIRNYGGNWDTQQDVFFQSELEPSYADKLAKQVIYRVRKVYENNPFLCQFVDESLWASRNMTDPCSVKPNTFTSAK